MKAKDLSNFVTLSTLKVLNILILLNADMALLPPERNIISIRDIKTIEPSKTFIISFK